MYRVNVNWNITNLSKDFSINLFLPLFNWKSKQKAMCDEKNLQNPHIEISLVISAGCEYFDSCMMTSRLIYYVNTS